MPTHENTPPPQPTSISVKRETSRGVACNAQHGVYQGKTARLPFITTLLLTLLLITLPINAQDDTPQNDFLTYGQVVTGRLDDATALTVYKFDALRCDFLSVRLTVTNGTLDPVVTILDDSGAAIFNRDDSQGRNDIAFDPIAIPRSGRYSIVVGRFGYALGSTEGTYELIIERIGNGSAYGCALRYGDTVFNSIDNATNELFYSFRALQGDIVNIRMESRSGDLDPFLQVVDGGGFVMASNDDVIGSGTDAEIESIFIPQDGTYYIIATRYGQTSGTSSGNFVLTIEEAEGSGLGNSAQAAIPIRLGNTVNGTLTNAEFERYYRFEAQRNDLITVRMARESDNLDTYLVITNANLQEIAFNDDSNDTQNSLISAFLLPENGTYYLIATRFERENGTTTGDYVLELQALGNAFDDVPANVRRLNYGSTITGDIDEIVTDGLFAFWGTEGEVITVAMNRNDGDLDPFIELLAGDRESVLASDDDSGGGQNARIDRFEIPSTGIYYIRATRFSGQASADTTGSYTVVLARRLDE